MNVGSELPRRNSKHFSRLLGKNRHQNHWRAILQLRRRCWCKLAVMVHVSAPSDPGWFASWKERRLLQQGRVPRHFRELSVADRIVLAYSHMAYQIPTTPVRSVHLNSTSSMQEWQALRSISVRWSNIVGTLSWIGPKLVPILICCPCIRSATPWTPPFMRWVWTTSVCLPTYQHATGNRPPQLAPPQISPTQLSGQPSSSTCAASAGYEPSGHVDKSKKILQHDLKEASFEDHMAHPPKMVTCHLPMDISLLHQPSWQETPPGTPTDKDLLDDVDLAKLWRIHTETVTEVSQHSWAQTPQPNNAMAARFLDDPCNPDAHPVLLRKSEQYLSLPASQIFAFLFWWDKRRNEEECYVYT